MNNIKNNFFFWFVISLCVIKSQDSQSSNFKGGSKITLLDKVICRLYKGFESFCDKIEESSFYQTYCSEMITRVLKENGASCPEYRATKMLLEKLEEKKSRVEAGVKKGY